MNSFLVKAANILAKVIGVVALGEPLINEALPSSVTTKAAGVEAVVNNELTSIGGAIVSAQAAAAALPPGKISDEDVINIAMPAVSQVIQSSPFMTGKEITDTAAYTKLVTDITTAFHGMLGVIKAK